MTISTNDIDTIEIKKLYWIKAYKQGTQTSGIVIWAAPQTLTFADGTLQHFACFEVKATKIKAVSQHPRQLWFASHFSPIRTGMKLKSYMVNALFNALLNAHTHFMTESSSSYHLQEKNKFLHLISIFKKVHVWQFCNIQWCLSSFGIEVH